VIQTEQRTMQTKVQVSGDSRVVEGYALKFNKRSQPLNLGDGNYFVESLDSRCLDNTDMSNVVATFNHDQSKLLGRSGVNLSLSKDDTGLRFKIDLPNTTVANDVLEEVRTGILSQCSFAFTMPDVDSADEWRASDKDGISYERTIRSIDKLHDVSIVTTPAYEDTDVAVGARSKEMIEKLDKEPLIIAREQKRKMLLRKLNIEEMKKITD